MVREDKRNNFWGRSKAKEYLKWLLLAREKERNRERGRKREREE